MLSLHGLCDLCALCALCVCPRIREKTRLPAFSDLETILPDLCSRARQAGGSTLATLGFMQQPGLEGSRPGRSLSERRRFAGSLLVAFAGGAILMGCDRLPASLPNVASQPAIEPVLDVQTASLHRGGVSQRILAPGSVVARRESQIGTEVAGRIVRVHVAHGERVEAGQPLFEIDPAPYEMALRQAQAGRDVAEAERRQIEADLQRARTLRQQKVLAEQETERLTTTLAVAGAHVRQAEEAVALAQHHLERTVVRAPYAGSVAARLADEGTTALVQPQTIVVVLQETTELEARVSIAESQMGLVNAGDTAVVRIEGVLEPLRTQVSAVSDSIDAATRTYVVKMPVLNPNHQIKAGVFAQVEIELQRRDDVLLAPRESIRVEDGRMSLLAVRDGRVESLPIEVGVVAENEVEITAGADDGQTVVVGEAARDIAPGMRVRPATAAAVGS